MIIDLCVIHGSSPVSTTQGDVTFIASPQHATVTSYEGRVRAAGSATVIATQNFGKPTPDEDFLITANMRPTLATLAAGNYTVTVAAIAPGGTTEATETSVFSIPLT